MPKKYIEILQILAKKRLGLIELVLFHYCLSKGRDWIYGSIELSSTVSEKVAHFCIRGMNMYILQAVPSHHQQATICLMFFITLGNSSFICHNSLIFIDLDLATIMLCKSSKRATIFSFCFLFNVVLGPEMQGEGFQLFLLKTCEKLCYFFASKQKNRK